jgi:hypothetical protein
MSDCDPSNDRVAIVILLIALQVKADARASEIYESHCGVVKHAHREHLNVRPPPRISYPVRG